MAWFFLYLREFIRIVRAVCEGVSSPFDDPNEKKQIHEKEFSSWVFSPTYSCRFL